MAIGNTLEMLEGNFALSNSVSINTSNCSGGGNISFEEYPSDFSIYPNPSTEVLTIKNDIPSKNGSTVYIYDSFGKLVAAYSIKQQAIQVNISDYSEGYYYIKMIAGENESSRSFTKI